MKSIRSIGILVTLLLCSLAFAADPAPIVMLKNVSNKMIVELDKNIGNLKSNDRLVYNLVQRVLVPHFDLDNMSRNVVSKERWEGADAATKRQFINEFTKYVIRTYSSAIQSYDGETIKFYPLRGEIAGQNKVQVNSDLMHKDGPPIQLQYRLISKGNDWFVYDFSVDGISIVQNYRSQFAEVLRKEGLVQLVQQLKNHNKGI